MHYGNDWNGGSWWWIPMMLMMVVFWGGLIWLGVALVRRSGHAPAAPMTPSSPSTSMRSTPQEILAERLARGEIEPDDYRSRKAVLDSDGR
ncbi:MAG: SHOCT domain-containing protein [Actinobacteria bacterium]|nr:SHOCT domain-containing protein [Actinomycetota bacterium]